MWVLINTLLYNIFNVIELVECQKKIDIFNGFDYFYAKDFLHSIQVCEAWIRAKMGF